MAKEKQTNKIEKNIKIEGQQWEEALNSAFLKKQKEVTVDGFRKGKVPRDMYEKKFGKESLFIDAADLVLQDAYMKIMTDNQDLIPVVQPKVDLKSLAEDGVEFVFTFITAPTVNVKKYKGLKVKKEEVKVTKEEIAHELGHVLERFAEIVTKEGKVANGDIAVIDFEGFNNGVAFDGGKGENYSLEIGSNTFIPGFEEQVIGMKTGEEKDINVTFPEEYPSEDLKGKPVVFKVKVNEIKTKQQREMDKDFFEDLGMEGIDTKEKLEEEIKENIKVNKEADADNKYLDDLFKEIGKNTEVDIPEEMIEDELNRMIARYEEQLKMQGISLETYYAFTHSDENTLREQMKEEASNHVLYRLMLEEIMKIEKVEVTEEEVDKEAKDLAEKYQMKEEEFITAFGGKEMIRYDLEMKKVIEVLKDLNK